MGYLSATEYTLEENIGDNTIAIIDRKEADGTFKTFISITDEDGGTALVSARDMNAIALKIVELELEMKENSPLREKI
jgi:hypothetical protein